MRTILHTLCLLVFLYPCTGFSAAEEGIRPEDKSLTRSQVIEYRAEYRRWKTYMERIDEVSPERRDAAWEKATNRRAYLKRILRKATTDSREAKGPPHSAFSTIAARLSRVGLFIITPPS
tara:strand:+ start:6480 stop:6839 length:360 start_codon:yes stop_codon:yes gene_type:complete